MKSVNKFIRMANFVSPALTGMLALLINVTTVLADVKHPAVKTVRVNNYDMSYVEQGNGPPLILVHGSLSDYRTWLPLMSEFSETNRAISVSLRHYYPEKWNGKGNDFSIQQHADDIAAFIKALQFESVDLLGHSRGAVVSMLVASQHPKLVRHLVLADPAPLKSILYSNRKTKRLLDIRKVKMQQTVNLYRQGKPDAGLELFVNYIAGPNAWEKTSETRRATLRDNSWTQINQLRDFETPFQCNNAAKISSPVLMITGERSGPLYGYMLSALESCLKQSNNALIADSGHMMHTANPTAFVFEVQEFIAPN